MKNIIHSTSKNTQKTVFALMALAVALTGRPAAADCYTGSADDIDALNSRQVMVYHGTFTGGEQALVSAMGTGDVDIKVYDENGNLIASDTDTDAVPLVTWTPAWTGRFTVKVINATHRRIAYTLHIR